MAGCLQNNLQGIFIKNVESYTYSCNAIFCVFNKLATLVEDDPKAPFSIATTPRCWGGRYSFLWKVKLATIFESDLKAPFSIATTPRCRGRRYSFP